MKFRWNAFQLQGARPRQEDAYRIKVMFDEVARSVEKSMAVLAIADGLGGHPDGDWASRLASDTAVDAFELTTDGELPGLPDKARWREVFVHCNDRLWDRPPPRFSSRRPCTTLIAGAVDPDGHFTLAFVGDSSAWLVMPQGVRRLCGEYGSGSWVRFCVGYDIRGGVAVQMAEDTLEPGCRLVLATDGLEVLPEALIESLIQLPLDQAIAELNRAVVAAMGEQQDNVTVLILEAIT